MRNFDGDTCSSIPERIMNLDYNGLLRVLFRTQMGTALMKVKRRGALDSKGLLTISCELCTHSNM